MSKIFRFDDICVNCNMDTVNLMTDYILQNVPDSQVLWGISPLVHNMSNETGSKVERVYPKIFNALSDINVFFRPNIAGVPKLRDDVVTAGHGLIHIDHRLLTPEQQEMSILISCSLANAKVFIPPFNKWNVHTELICNENNIKLIKFENGWKCMEYNNYDSNHELWYIHSREMSYENFVNWFNI